MKTEGVRKLWDRYKYAALILLIGAGLLLWPGGSGHTAQTGQSEAPPAYTAAETLLLDGGDREETVVTGMAYPSYRGALVVCQGGDRADVKLAVTEAVSALTGLSSDRVTVAKCQ